MELKCQNCNSEQGKGFRLFFSIHDLDHNGNITKENPDGFRVLQCLECEIVAPVEAFVVTGTAVNDPNTLTN